MYMKEARSLGYILGKRGHTCVNGAGAFGCMAAMNDGACAGDGHIVGVIHEMWLPKKKKEKNPSSSSAATVTIDALRDGGAHPVFESIENSNASSTAANTATSATPVADSNATSKSSTKKKNRSPRSSLNDYPKREMLVAGGKDLQERKRLLVDKADALVVLPGGTGYVRVIIVGVFFMCCLFPLLASCLLRCALHPLCAYVCCSGFSFFAARGTNCGKWRVRGALV